LRIAPDFQKGQIVVDRRIAAPRIDSFQKTLRPGRAIHHFQVVM
jgi:hypothetical protein